MNNKPNLWIFGDSFSVPSAVWNTHPDFDNWIDIVASRLGVEGYNYSAEWGVSNDWIFAQLIDKLNDIPSGDYVIVQTTQKHRQWFFEDQPDLSNYYVMNFEKQVSEAKANAVKEYITHLQNDNLDHIRYIQFCLALERLCSIFDNLKILILPGFWSLNGCVGNLVTVSDNEFTSKTHHEFYEKNNGKDPRVNHLSENNHKILANKILDFFQTGSTVDLTQGFEENIYKD